MEAPTALGTVGWRAWALVPVVLLALCVALVVGAFSQSGSSLVDLIGKNPPPADQFDVRRVVFEPDEIEERRSRRDERAHDGREQQDRGERPEPPRGPRATGLADLHQATTSK